jgi:hypothetical protein
MAMAVRRPVTALLGGAALAALPMAVGTIATPASGHAVCEVGQVDTGRGCAPACSEGHYLDTRSGRCHDLPSAITTELAGGPANIGVPSLPAPSELPPLVSAPVEVPQPGVRLPGIGIGLDLWPDLPPIGVPAPEVGVPEVGLPGVGLPQRPPLCGPGIETPIPMVGFTPCI